MAAPAPAPAPALAPMYLMPGPSASASAPAADISPGAAGGIFWGAVGGGLLLLLLVLACLGGLYKFWQAAKVYRHTKVTPFWTRRRSTAPVITEMADGSLSSVAAKA